jgi:hypothetical protein
MTIKASFVCDNTTCGKTVDVEPVLPVGIKQFIPPPEWYEVQVDDSFYDACSERCAQAIAGRVEAATQRDRRAARKRAQNPNPGFQV